MVFVGALDLPNLVLVGIVPERDIEMRDIEIADNRQLAAVA